jgi:hypothetical protein
MYILFYRIYMRLFLLTILFIAAHSYNITQLITSVLLSGAAYCDDYSKPLDNLNVLDTFHDEYTDVRGFAAMMDDTYYIALRGSSSAQNWIDDFEIRLVDYNGCAGCSVHHGFYKSALAIKSQVMNSIETHSPKNIIVTGHSYGAAVAQILALEINKNAFVYNFGQPRTGNSEFANHVNRMLPNYWRVTHDRDIVPHLPPKIGYIHSCGELFENSDGELSECSAIDCEDPKCSQQYRTIQTKTEDHLYYMGYRVTCKN